MSGIIHEAVKPISWLLGTWKSTSARGSYPTMNDFEYTEVIEFTSVGKMIFKLNVFIIENWRLFKVR